MPLLLLKELPRFECLLQAAERYPDLHPASTDAFLNLLRTSDLLATSHGQLLSDNHLSPGRFTVLMLLSRHPDQPETPASLADAAGVTRATMTGLLDTLEKDRLIRRTPDAADRRLTLIQLTRSGRDLMEALLPKYFRNVANLMAPLQPEERTLLVELLQKIQIPLTPPAPLVESDPQDAPVPSPVQTPA